jgi:hypothetical protein
VRELVFVLAGQGLKLASIGGIVRNIGIKSKAPIEAGKE